MNYRNKTKEEICVRRICFKTDFYTWDFLSKKQGYYFTSQQITSVTEQCHLVLQLQYYTYTEFCLSMSSTDIERVLAG
jgi:hypothetical protein